MVLNAHISIVSYLLAHILGWIYLAYFSHEPRINHFLSKMYILGFEL